MNKARRYSPEVRERLKGLERENREVRRTTESDETAPRPLDLMGRDFSAERPNELWVSDLTYVATWRAFAYLASVIDAFSRRIVGRRVSSSLRSDLALHALEQALYERQDEATDALVHHSDRLSPASTCRSATPDGSPRPASSPRSAAGAIPSTTPRPNR